MAKLIGTAGHVDHGKTTLIKALTGIDADRLPEEKARGMTIDIGFAYLDLPDHGRVSIVDVPGHERFISNMLVGALGIDVALLCVAADEGVKPQTREHFQILELLPVNELVVALTKADLPDTLEIAELDVQDLLRGTRFEGAPIVHVSAQTGVGLEELKTELAQRLTRSKREETGTWYLPIDRVFTVKGYGCVVTGTLARGRVRVGDEVALTPGGLGARVRGIHSHDEEREVAEPGQRTALNLAGVKEEEVHRGQTASAKGAIFETTCLDARVRWTIVPRHAEKVRVSIGAAEVIGRAFLSEEDEKLVQLRLQEPAPVALGQPVIIRRHSPPDLLGGGLVEVPQSKPRKRGETTAKVEGRDLESSLLAIVAANPAGVETAEVCRRLGRTPQELGNVFEALSKKGALRGFAGLWLTSENWEACARRVAEALSELHRKQPTAPWQPREAVLKLANLSWSGKPLDRAIALLDEEGRIVQQGTAMRLPDFSLQLTDRQRSFLDRVKAELEKEPVTTPNPHQLSLSLHAPMPAVEEILKLGQMAGEIVLLEGDVAYTLPQIEEIKKQLREMAQGKPFTAGQARDYLKASRKYMIPLLEYLDKVQFTIRIGDNRAIRS